MINERTNRANRAAQAASAILNAIRTAPKARGADIVEAAILEPDDIARLSAEMKSMAETSGARGMMRDAENILRADALVIVGTRPMPIGLNCTRCGFETCAQKPANVPCAINVADVGIAIGSACATCADLRIDSRVMHSAGLAAARLALLGPATGQVYAIPLSISSKNPFFDR